MALKDKYLSGLTYLETAIPPGPLNPSKEVIIEGAVGLEISTTERVSALTFPT
jgi:hypothetical protein